MTRMMIALLAVLVVGTAQAEEATCRARATDQKLVGAELSAFLKQCHRDAAAKCDAKAAAEGVPDTEKVNFIKRCYNAAVGT